MDDDDSRARALRRRIEYYRRRLREGIDGDLASFYLLEIGDAELLLSELENRRRASVAACTGTLYRLK